MRTSPSFTFLLTILLLLLSIPSSVCDGADIISTNQTFRDGDTILSSGGNFELGFFSPGKSTNRYLGIWYRKITVLTVVWVANRDSPINNSSGSGAVLKLVQSGILILQNSTNSTVWSTNTSTTASRGAQFPVAQLLDNGNLVVKEANDDNPDNYLWQSFENPTDTLLAGMKLGHLRDGHENYLSSWKSSDDPGTGPYTYHLDPTGYPQAILRRDSVEQYRTGPWNGNGYSGLPRLQNDSIYTYDMVINGNTVYYEYQIRNDSVITRFMVNYSGITQRWAWIGRTQGWTLYLTAPTDSCDNYNQCGPYASCDLANTPNCGCLGKFVPQFPEAWAMVDYSRGCVRRTPLNCSTDGFVKYSEVKLPDARSAMWVNRSMTLSECRAECQRNCSCMAYATVEVRNDGYRCLRWFEDLLDIKQVSGAGQDIFIRMASSELDSEKKKAKILIASLASVGGVIVVVGSIVLFCICKRRKFYLKLRKEAVEKGGNKDENNDLELPLFDLNKIYKATRSFSHSNKLGEGGFGPVYKGTFDDGQEIAVKRLSQTSFQGLNECRNEVVCIAKLQHRNLVKLLGCCIQGEENMLIYEYMPNKSLDLILFDEKKSRLLDWPKRFHIITCIARGLLYLHQDSRLTVIHRDLKVSNILLDGHMNPKISDFGMARIFEGNETQANTKRIVGTYGYMSPEYASVGLFSMKSDVYSFGVIMLEIISGQRNRGFAHKDHPHNLLGHAWMLHRDSKSLELVQDNIMESCSIHEVLRSIHVGLLCVQAYPDDRPSMSLVVKMLENDMELPPARQPGFFVELGDKNYVHDISGSTKSISKNEISVTMLGPR